MVGRPKKVVPPDEVLNAGPARPRGRPKKNTTAAVPATGETAEVPAAKKRGRPRTKPVAEPVNKRPKGRPTKAARALESTEVNKGGDQDIGGETTQKGGEKGTEAGNDVALKTKSAGIDLQKRVDEEAEDSKNVGKKETSEGKKDTKVAKEAKYKAAVEQASNSKEPWSVMVHKSPDPEWFAYRPETMRQTVEAEDGKRVVKLISWNVAGLRSVLKPKKGAKGLPDTAPIDTCTERAEEEAMALEQIEELEDPDLICLQETKIQEKGIESVKQGLLPNYPHSHWTCSTVNLGYSGCALFSKVAPLDVTLGLAALSDDTEGRVITAEFDKFFVVVTYVPNAGEGLRRLAYREEEWDVALGNHCKDLAKKKPVILAGDLNCAHREIDICNPLANLQSPGFTLVERNSFEHQFLQQGLVDSFRRQHPAGVGYTYWGYRMKCRPKNTGWRLDYVLASESLLQSRFDSFTMPQIMGSDHCPLGLSFMV